MTTAWTLPNTVSQYAETSFENIHVSWLEIDNFSSLKTKDLKSVRTSRDLVHIARDPRHDILEKTFFLKCTGFSFTNLPLIISGIEVKLTMNRFGRITDDVIQLCLDDNLIGINKADLNLDPIKVYGTASDIWETSLTAENIQSNSFGVILRFESHPNWPHKCSALIDAVEIRIH